MVIGLGFARAAWTPVGSAQRRRCGSLPACPGRRAAHRGDGAGDPEGSPVSRRSGVARRCIPTRADRRRARPRVGRRVACKKVCFSPPPEGTARRVAARDCPNPFAVCRPARAGAGATSKPGDIRADPRLPAGLRAWRLRVRSIPAALCHRRRKRGEARAELRAANRADRARLAGGTAARGRSPNAARSKQSSQGSCLGPGSRLHDVVSASSSESAKL